MMTVPVLAMLDFSKEFLVEINALGVGLGVVLMQEGRSIAYLSKTLSIRNQGNSIYKS